MSNLDKNPKSHLLSGEALQEGNTHQHIPPIPHYIFNFLKRSLIHTNLYISPIQLGETLDSGEHSLADSQGADFHPGPALRKAHSLEHIDIEARRGPASREHSRVKHSGTKDLPGPALSLKDSIAHKESPASGGPDSRDCSTAKSSRGINSSIALSGTHRIAHKSNPASGGPDSRDHSTTYPSGLSNPSDKTEETYSKGHHPPRHISDHPPMTPPRLTSGA